MIKGLNDFLDKHEGREIGSSTKAINKERVRQGYSSIKEKKQSIAKKMVGKKGKGSLKSTGKNEGEKMYLGKNENNRA